MNWSSRSLGGDHLNKSAFTERTNESRSTTIARDRVITANASTLISTRIHVETRISVAFDSDARIRRRDDVKRSGAIVHVIRIIDMNPFATGDEFLMMIIQEPTARARHLIAREMRHRLPIGRRHQIGTLIETRCLSGNAGRSTQIATAHILSACILAKVAHSIANIGGKCIAFATRIFAGAITQGLT